MKQLLQKYEKHKITSKTRTFPNIIWGLILMLQNFNGDNFVHSMSSM